MTAYAGCEGEIPVGWELLAGKMEIQVLYGYELDESIDGMGAGCGV